MKNKEQIHEEIVELAKDNFTTHGCVIKKGLDTFYKYQGMDIHEFLMENKTEECIARAMDDMDMTEEEVLFLALDTYKAFVLNMTVAQRLKDVELGEYVYDFNIMTCRKVFKQQSHAEVLEQNRKALILEQEEIIDDAIAKAQTILASKDKEVAEAQAKISKIESEISKINGKLMLLKAKDIVTMKPSERAKNKNEISSLESKSIILMKQLQEAKEELKQLKNERFYINEDVNAMVKILENADSNGYYEVDKIKMKYR